MHILRCIKLAHIRVHQVCISGCIKCTYQDASNSHIRMRQMHTLGCIKCTYQDTSNAHIRMHQMHILGCIKFTYQGASNAQIMVHQIHILGRIKCTYQDASNVLNFKDSSTLRWEKKNLKDYFMQNSKNIGILMIKNNSTILINGNTIYYSILIIHKPSLGSCEVPQKL